MDNMQVSEEQLIFKVTTELLECKDQGQADSYLLETVCPELLATPLEQLPDATSRNSIVKAITERYYILFDSFPQSLVLTLLGNYLLLDYIKDKTKTKNDELQFLTPTQAKRRKGKEFSAVEDTMDFLQSKHVRKMDSLKKKATVVYNENE